MKRMHLRLSKRANCVSASLLMFLGFSCTDGEGEGPIACEYGTPYADLQIKGRVVDTNDRSIPNAQIRINRNDTRIYPYGWLHIDTVRTDANGKFDWKKTGFPILKYRFIMEDIDEEMNGKRFASDATQVTFDSEELTGGDRWYKGGAPKGIKVTLKEYVDTHTEPYALYTVYGRVTGNQGYPLIGVAILASPAYALTQEDDLSNFPVITDETRRYQFTHDKAMAVEHTIYTELSSYWNGPNARKTDSTIVNFAEVELLQGKGVLIDKGSKEISFQLTRKNQKMGAVYHSILKGFSWILAGPLSLLSFSVTSCGATDEYDSPYAEYELKGRVTSMSGDPIRRIEFNYGGICNNVLFSPYISEMYKSPRTQKDESYNIKFEDSPMGIVRIIAKDIDGPENESFETDSIDIKIEGFGGGRS